MYLNIEQENNISMKKNSGEKIRILQEQKLLQLERQSKLLLEELKMARLDGDFSENGDLTENWKKIETLQRQILFISRNIKTVEKNEFITYRILETEKEKTVELVNKLEINHEQNKISRVSPLGLILATKKVGEIGEVKAPKGSYKVKIINKK
jgi:transcription elongation factor GreA